MNGKNPLRVAPWERPLPVVVPVAEPVVRPKKPSSPADKALAMASRLLYSKLQGEAREALEGGPSMSTDRLENVILYRAFSCMGHRKTMDEGTDLLTTVYNGRLKAKMLPMAADPKPIIPVKESRPVGPGAP